MSNFSSLPFKMWDAPLLKLWQDIILTTEDTGLSALTIVDFEIFVCVGEETETIMSGRAAKRPGDTYVTVRANDIVRGYLRDNINFNHLPDSGDYPDVPGRYWTAPSSCSSEEEPSIAVGIGGALRVGDKTPDTALKFGIVWSDPDGELADVAEYFTVVADRSYLPKENDLTVYPYDRYTAMYTPDNILNDPIDYVVDSRQLLFLSALCANRVCFCRMPDQRYVPGYYDIMWWLSSVSRPDSATCPDVENVPASDVVEAADIIGFKQPHHFYLMPGYCNVDTAIDLLDEKGGRLFYFAFNSIPIVNGEYVRIPDEDPDTDIERYRIKLGTFPRDIWGSLSDTERKKRCFCVRETDADYCLYYVNAYGGIDALLVTRKAVEKRSIERQTAFFHNVPGSFERISDPRWAREKAVISTSVTRGLVLHTAWLSDEQAARMHHLLESPRVWVHDLKKSGLHAHHLPGTLNEVRQAIYPAVLTGSSYDIKTYNNQGHKLIQYEISLDYSFTEER